MTSSWTSLDKTTPSRTTGVKRWARDSNLRERERFRSGLIYLDFTTGEDANGSLSVAFQGAGTRTNGGSSRAVDFAQSHFGMQLNAVQRNTMLALLPSTVLRFVPLRSALLRSLRFLPSLLHFSSFAPDCRLDSSNNARNTSVFYPGMNFFLVQLFFSQFGTQKFIFVRTNYSRNIIRFENKLDNSRKRRDRGMLEDTIMNHFEKESHSPVPRKLHQRIQRRYSEDKGDRGREREREAERGRASERASEQQKERERERDREGWENGGSEDIRHQIEGDAIAKRGTAPLSSVLASPSVIGPSDARYPN